MTARKPRDPAWIPVTYSLDAVASIKALAQGKATAEQQAIAVKWIIETAAGTYDLSFRSNADGGDRETAFAEGKRSVGMQIVKIINMAPALVAAMREKNG